MAKRYHGEHHPDESMRNLFQMHIWPGSCVVPVNVNLFANKTLSFAPIPENEMNKRSLLNLCLFQSILQMTGKKVFHLFFK